MLELHIVNLIDDKHDIDNSNALAITNELMKQYPDALSSTKHIDEIVDYVESVKEIPNTKYIFIGASSKCLYHLSYAKKALDDCLTIYYSHKADKLILEHEHNLDKIAVPTSENLLLKDSSKIIKDFSNTASVKQQITTAIGDIPRVIY